MSLEEVGVRAWIPRIQKTEGLNSQLLKRQKDTGDLDLLVLKKDDDEALKSWGDEG